MARSSRFVFGQEARPVLAAALRRPAGGRQINEAGNVAEVVGWSTGRLGVSWPIGYGCTVYACNQKTED